MPGNHYKFVSGHKPDKDAICDFVKWRQSWVITSVSLRVCVYMCARTHERAPLYVYVYLSTCACRIQKKVSNSLKLELQRVGSPV